MLDNPFSYRASSRLRLDKCSDGCVWGENSRGWLVESWRGDEGYEGRETEEKWSLRMHYGKRKQINLNKLCRAAGKSS